jgi:superfamily II DNA or RNA helicase
MSFEIGERVTFRSLLWEVEDTSSETSLALFGRSAENQGRRIRVLLDLDEIARAELPTLRWTIGAKGWDVRQWKALHDAFRFTLSHARGNLSSVDWGRLVLEPYQLEPLQRIENLPFPRLLLADDTGLGKTAEAGLILFRLMQKRRADRVLVLCKAQPEPERWQRELRDKFGIETVVINDNEDFKRLRREVPAHLNLFGYYPRIVMSMFYASQTHVMDDLRRGVRWDVAIIDEAHHMAEREGSVKRLAELGRVIADQSEALLLLTATPHDGKAATYASLIQLLDPYAIVDPDRLDASIIRPLVVRRLKGEVEKADGSRFQPREIHVLDIGKYRKKAERELDRGIRDYAARLKLLSQHLKDQGQHERAFGAAFLGTFFKKRLASSVYACRRSLQERLSTVRGRPPAQPDAPLYIQQTLSELAEEGETIADATPSTEGVEGFTFEGGDTEEALLERLLQQAEKVEEEQEAKVQALFHLLERRLENPQEKVVIFTEFRDTLELVERILSAHGYGSMLVTYHGATSPADRDLHRRAFLTNPRVRIFLATDAASEGINLHKTCNTLIHIEIPWNPNRYEQRNGRIDRYGQQSKPHIFLLVSPRSVEQRVAEVVIQKLERIRKELGSVSNVFPIAQRLKIEEFLHQVDTTTIDQQEQLLSDEAAVNPAIEAITKHVERQFDQLHQESMQAGESAIPTELAQGEHFGHQERLALQKQLEASRAFVPEYQDVEAFLRIFMTSPDMEGGQIRPTQEPGVWSIDIPRRLQRELRDAYGQLRERYPRATFQRQLAIQEAEQEVEAERRVEFLSPGHPLVQVALRFMRGCAFKPDFPSRVAYRRTPLGSTPGYIFTYAARFVDGRGEAIEERFEAIFVAVDGQVSQDPDEDMRLFTERRPFGNLSPQEATEVLPVFRAAFDSAKEAALQEMERRRDQRCQELRHVQAHIADEAFVRLGRWLNTSEARLQRRFSDLPVGGNLVQLRFETPEVRRRQTLLRKEEEKLRSKEQERRRDIAAMREVRGETIDAIGALALIPERYEPPAR